MNQSIGPVWVLAEQVNHKLLTETFQIIGKARQLADQLHVNVEAILLGENASRLANRLIEAGADRVYVNDSENLTIYQSEPYKELITALAGRHHPDILLIGSSHMGRELAPLVAASLKTGLTAHCMDLVLNNDNILEQLIPAYGGIISIECPQKRPQMATIARGVFSTPEFDKSRTGEIVPVDYQTNREYRVKTLEVVREDPEGIPLDTACAVVAGGAGAGNADGWQQIAELANTLNAALGCTRPAVDEGWTDLGLMIGQSGKMISPDLYIGVGLSGELQHMVGIVGAKVMVAINNDKKSPVFKQVDFGIVDDCHEFVPILIEKIKAYRSSN